MSGTCRQCDRARIKRWTARNKDRVAENGRRWKAANPDKCAEYVRRTLAKAKAERGFTPMTDEQRRESRRRSKRAYYAKSAGYRLQQRLRKRVAKALGGKIAGKLGARWFGCSPAELMAHLEAQFTAGMTWENRGEWHVDHVRPLASFDLSDPEQRRLACHYTNLQPLWAEDNLRKHAKWDLAA